jgi:hypothetical protein
MLQAVLFMPDGKIKKFLKTLAILSASSGAIGTWVILSTGARVVFGDDATRPSWLFYMIIGGVFLVTLSLAFGGAWLFHRQGGVLCSRNNAAELGGICMFLLTMHVFPEDRLAAQLSKYEPFEVGVGQHADAAGAFIALASALVVYKLVFLLISTLLTEINARQCGSSSTGSSGGTGGPPV